MRKLLFGSIAALGLALGFVPQQASAAWLVNTVYRYDPACHKYVAVTERKWVPDCETPVVVHRHRHHHHRHVVVTPPAVILR